MIRYHVTEDGPERCRNVYGVCKYEKIPNSHFRSIADAQKEFEKRQSEQGDGQILEWKSTQETGFQRRIKSNRKIISVPEKNRIRFGWRIWMALNLWNIDTVSPRLYEKLEENSLPVSEKTKLTCKLLHNL